MIILCGANCFFYCRFECYTKKCFECFEIYIHFYKIKKLDENGMSEHSHITYYTIFRKMCTENKSIYGKERRKTSYCTYKIPEIFDYLKNFIKIYKIIE